MLYRSAFYLLILLIPHFGLAAGTCLDDQLHCPKEHDCFPMINRCDGFWDCPLYGSDEFDCGKLMLFSSWLVGARCGHLALAPIWLLRLEDLFPGRMS